MFFFLNAYNDDICFNTNTCVVFINILYKMQYKTHTHTQTCKTHRHTDTKPTFEVDIKLLILRYLKCNSYREKSINSKEMLFLY